MDLRGDKLDPISEQIRINSLQMDADFIYAVYREYIESQEYKDMIIADDYYNYKHDILKKSRWREKGNPEFPLPDEKMIDNQYAKMVDQKRNYLLSKPFKTEIEGDKKFESAIGSIIDFRFRKRLKDIGGDAINKKVGYLYGYWDNNGELKFKKFIPQNIIPFYIDEDEEELDAFIRFFTAVDYKDKDKKEKTYIEFYNRQNIKTYEVENSGLKLLFEMPYAQKNGVDFTWDKIPLFVFKPNPNPMPLINKCKSLQDGINTILSTFGNNMQEDARSTVLVVKNYDGQNWKEFRSELMKLGVIPVSGDGGVDSLHIEVNAENYESILKILKKALIENCRGFDAKDERISGSNFNQMNIQSMYNDIDLDASDMELEFQATLEELIEFVNSALGIQGKVKFTFDRNMMMNESQAITEFVNSNEISLQTRLGKHPWVEDVEEEMKRIENEEMDRIKRMDDYNMNPFNQNLGKNHGEET